ncbi:UNVERIFIED_CONTAM: hypothetical protein PYX00_000412 [Menopon gallinae]|uniref:Uncharacterized protein n=1 Tax=Menopon gallinae TaxID=328185 RepID=A0AAW2I928_9NEOP
MTVYYRPSYTKCQTLALAEKRVYKPRTAQWAMERRVKKQRKLFVKCLKWKWAERLMRTGDKKWAIWIPILGQKKKGKPGKRWEDDIKNKHTEIDQTNAERKMKKKSISVMLSLIFIIGTVLFSGVLCQAEAQPNGTVAQTTVRTAEWRPSFWTKTANNLKASTLLRMYKPYGDLTKLQKRLATDQGSNNSLQKAENIPNQFPRRVKAKIRTTTEESTTETGNFETTTLLSMESDDIETKIMKDESFIGLKEFASQLINDTVKLFSKKEGQPRSYPIDEPPQHQLWDDKDQTYHASSFTTAEYEPTSFHHHYIPPPPLHYYPPPKKEDALLTKVAMIALLKLILAKLKAIGFLKLMFLFMMKVPVLFFKFLFILKSFKLLKLVSIPFIMASFAAPFLPLIPFFAPLLFAPIFFAPLFLPLMLPLLFFLPIVPVSTPQTASGSTVRRRREATFNAPIEEPAQNGTRARYMRLRPKTYENRKNLFEYAGKSSYSQEVEESPNLIELTQKIADSQRCMERVACELARQNDSKIYQAAVMWALGKVHDFASQRVRRKIERYSDAYKMGTKLKSSDFCQSKFYCQRPRILLVQGQAKYNVF